MLSYLPIDFIDFFTYGYSFSFDTKIIFFFIHCVTLLFMLSDFGF